MKKILRKLHLWLSIPFGIVISILCLTGALLVFENEIKELCSPSLYRANRVRETPLPVEELAPIVKQQLPDSAVISNIQAPANPKSNYRVRMTGEMRTTLLVDPYTGEVKGEATPGFFSFVRRLHRWFLLPNQRDGISWGKMITGTSTLMFVFILISGAIVWIPKTMKQLKVRLKIHTRLSRFRFWYDTHLAGGIYAFLFLLAISLTGLTWSFKWYRDGFYALFGARTEQTASQQPPQAQPPQQPVPAEKSEGDQQPAEDKKGTDYAVWTDILHELKEENPGYKSISIQDGSATVSIHRTGNIRASDTYQFNPYTGEITGVNYYKDRSKPAKMKGWVYSVHVGAWGGWLTRILYFMACLTGAFLPWTGYYIYLKKWRNKRKKSCAA